MRRNNGIGLALISILLVQLSNGATTHRRHVDSQTTLLLVPVQGAYLDDIDIEDTSVEGRLRSLPKTEGPPPVPLQNDEDDDEENEEDDDEEGDDNDNESDNETEIEDDDDAEVFDKAPVKSQVKNKHPNTPKQTAAPYVKHEKPEEGEPNEDAADDDDPDRPELIPPPPELVQALQQSPEFFRSRGLLQNIFRGKDWDNYEADQGYTY